MDGLLWNVFACSNSSGIAVLFYCPKRSHGVNFTLSWAGLPCFGLAWLGFVRVEMGESRIA